MAVLHSTWLYWYSNGSTSLYHGSASLCLTVLQSTSLYHDSTSLYLTLLNTNMAILHSTCLYHGSILQFPWLWFTLPSLHFTLLDSLSLYLTLIHSILALLHSSLDLLDSSGIYFILSQLYFTLLDSTSFCSSYNSLYLNVRHSTTALLYAPEFYLIPLDSTSFYHGSISSVWLYFILPWPYWTLLDYILHSTLPLLDSTWL